MSRHNVTYKPGGAIGKPLEMTLKMRRAETALKGAAECPVDTTSRHKIYSWAMDDGENGVIRIALEIYDYNDNITPDYGAAPAAGDATYSGSIDFDGAVVNLSGRVRDNISTAGYPVIEVAIDKTALSGGAMLGEYYLTIDGTYFTGAIAVPMIASMPVLAIKDFYISAENLFTFHGGSFLSVYVVDAVTGGLVQGANVSVDNGGYQTQGTVISLLTDAYGNADIMVPENFFTGSVNITVSKPGYVSSPRLVYDY